MKELWFLGVEEIILFKKKTLLDSLYSSCKQSSLNIRVFLHILFCSFQWLRHLVGYLTKYAVEDPTYIKDYSLFS